MEFIVEKVKNIQPEDADKVMWYRESKDGVMLEEGINEAGAFSAWIALATSYSTNKKPMIPILYLLFNVWFSKNS